MSQNAFAFDRRRVNGPEWSVPPTYEDDPEDHHDDDTSMEAGPSNSTKRDFDSRQREGRGEDDIRPIFLKTGLITQANGSAYIEMQNVKIACAVYGPRQSTKPPYSEKGKLNVEVKYTPFGSSRRKNPMKEVESQSLSNILVQSLTPSLHLHLFPKSTIDVFLTVLEADSLSPSSSPPSSSSPTTRRGIEGDPTELGTAAACTIAASAALADAGFEMFGLVVACQAAVFYPSSGSPEKREKNESMDVDSAPVSEAEPVIYLDTTAEELTHASGSILLSCIPALNGSVTNIRQIGRVEVSAGGGRDVLGECMQRLLKRCGDIHAVVVKALVDGEEERRRIKALAQGTEGERSSSS